MKILIIISIVLVIIFLIGLSFMSIRMLKQTTVVKSSQLEEKKDSVS